ncbi:hypothetical protein ACFVFH_21015 [Streptomyces sp. NPDC057697]|uniref:hypothetical protein n=1 Tax=Streptomyces sp. NPDC057697 TaxID=3346219 RepID=UPI0036B4E2F2
MTLKLLTWPDDLSAPAKLDNGAISEWAWDAAVAAGHDPQKWQTQLEERLAERATEPTPA